MIGVLLSVVPFGPNPRMRILGVQKRVDERDALFHRFYCMKEGTPEFEAYYKAHPEKFVLDEKIRSMPELGYPGSKTYDPMTSPFQMATFDVIERTTRDLEWEPQSVEPDSVPASQEAFTRRIKGFATYLGADLVGTTKLNPAYIYSHIGRSPGKWGSPITLNHPNAIAIAVAMDYTMIRLAPKNTVTTESSFRYLEATKIAMIVARYINRLAMRPVRMWMEIIA